MKAIRRLRIPGIVWGAWAAASAQTLVQPDGTDAARKAFELTNGATPLRCRATPVKPALTYGLQFQTGYVIDVPLNQFGGGSHSLSILLRIKPDGRDPVYMITPDLTAKAMARADAELPGNWLVGEGAYGIETLVKDEVGRICRSQWRIEARSSPGEKDFRGALPPGAVQELGASRATPRTTDGRQIERLTILLHATAFRPRAAKIDPETIGMLADSLTSLLSELPAKSVRLVVFNLEKQAVLTSKDAFAARDLEDVKRACEHLELAVVDIKTLSSRSRVDVLSDLVVKELHNPQPPSAVIVMGPRASAETDTAFESEVSPASGMPWFYLQYWPSLQLAGARGMSAGGPTMMGQGMDPDSPMIIGRGGRPMPGRAGPAASLPPQVPDGIARLMHRLSGTTFSLHSPHDFAAAVRRMSAAVPMVTAPMEAATKPPAPGAAPPAAPAAAPPASEEKAAPPLAPKVQDKIPEPVEPTGKEDPVDVLVRLRDNVIQRATGVPNHTCVESVQRDRYEPRAGRAIKSCDNLMAARKHGGNILRLDITDWLRLDVGMADGREVFSWAGAPKFEEGDIDELIPDGAFGTGPYASMLISVFLHHDPHFILDGETTLRGVRAYQYSFRIAVDDSSYRVKTGHNWIITGYTGILLVDPRTSDLMRFIVRTDELPVSTAMCEVDTTLDYKMTPIAGFEYLMPNATRQRFLSIDGTEGENTVEFASCREFQGQSSLMFGNQSPGEGNAARALSAATLPEGLPLTVELTTPFTFGKAAAGDRIEGRLVEALRDSSSERVFAPAGSKVTGRLTRVELRHAGTGTYTVALRWEAVHSGDDTFALNVKPKRTLAPLKEVGREVLRQRGMEINLPPQGDEHDAIYHFPGQRLGVESGLRTEWITIAAH